MAFSPLGKSDEEVALSWNLSGCKLIGKGAFGKVFKQKCITDGKMYAIKEILLSGTREQWDYVQREVEANCNLGRHRNIVRFFDCLVSNNEKMQLCFFIKLELCEESLSSFIKAPLSDRIDMANSCFRDVAMGLAYIHKKGFIHRDIKPDNVLVSKSGDFKISDFGIASLRSKAIGMNVRTQGFGTALYMAPEQMNSQTYTNKVDVYSLGLIMLEYLSRPHTFEENNNRLREDRDLPSDIKARFPDTAELILYLTSRSPSKRPSAQSIADACNDGEINFQKERKFNPISKSSSSNQIRNSEGDFVRRGKSGSGGDTGLPSSQLFYCGLRKNECRCGRCDGQCGPSNGCPCNACVKLIHNSNGNHVWKGKSGSGGDTGVQPSQLFYCGLRKNECRCGRCDGQCGPSNGCPCNACVKLIHNSDGNPVWKGKSGSGGDTGLPPSQLFYCGLRKNECRCGRCDGQCGPTNGCPCNACIKLLRLDVY